MKYKPIGMAPVLRRTPGGFYFSGPQPILQSRIAPAGPDAGRRVTVPHPAVHRLDTLTSMVPCYSHL